MLLRALLANYVRQTVQKKLMESVAQAASAPVNDSGFGPHDEDQPREQQPFSVAILFGLGVESGGLIDVVEGLSTAKTAIATYHAGTLADHRVLVAEMGVGRQTATNVTVDVLDRFHPDWVIAAGFSSGMVDDLRRGAILMPNRITAAGDGELEVALNYNPHETAAERGFHVGRLLTWDNEVRTQTEKRRLAKEFDAVACDMESFAVANVCKHRKVRFLATRVISDTVHDELPKDVEVAIQQKSFAGKLGATTAAIFNRFSSVKDLWQMREDALIASDRLAHFLTAVVARLPVGTPQL